MGNDCQNIGKADSNLKAIYFSKSLYARISSYFSKVYNGKKFDLAE